MSSTEHRTVAPAPTTGPQIVVCIDPAEAAAFFPPQTRADLESMGPVTWCAPSQIAASAAFAEVVGPAEVLITAWGVPRLDRDRLALLPRLRLVAHAASSLRSITSDDFWSTGLPITQAGAAMSAAVAELSLTFTLSLLRRTHRADHALRTGATWQQARTFARAREISGVRIGVVGASRTGRRYLEACRALGAHLQVYDPYLDSNDEWSAVATGLHTLAATSDVLAVHAPATPETQGLIGADVIAAMPDGSAQVRVFVTIVLPLVRPILATLAIFVFLWHWNDLLWPLVVGQSDAARTLTVGLATLNTETATTANVMAATLVSFLPCLLIFAVLQRHIVSGILSGAVKG